MEELFPEGWLQEAKAGPTKPTKETANKLLNYAIQKIKLFTCDFPWNKHLEYIPSGFILLLESAQITKTDTGIYAYIDFASKNSLPLVSSEEGVASQYLFNLFYVKCELEKYLASETQIINFNYILDSIFTAGESLATLDMMHEIKTILSSHEKELSPSYATALTKEIKSAIFGREQREDKQKGGQNTRKLTPEVIARIQELFDELKAESPKSSKENIIYEIIDELEKGGLLLSESSIKTALKTPI